MYQNECGDECQYVRARECHEHSLDAQECREDVDQGNQVQELSAQGQENAAESGSIVSGESSSPGDSQNEGKVYELDSVSKKANPLQDNSILIVLSILFLVAIFIYGYRRKNEFD